MTASSAEMLVLDPSTPRSYWVCEAGKDIDTSRIHSVSQDPGETPSYGYVHTVEDQSAVSGPLDLPLLDEYRNPIPNDDSELHNWWSDRDPFQDMEEGQALGLQPATALWPCTMSWYGDIKYQDQSNSAASIASPLIPVDNQLWDSQAEHDEEAPGTPWLPRDYSFSPSSNSTQSFQSPQVASRATSSKTPIQMKGIWPKPILPRPKKDDENRDYFNESNPKKGEPQLRRRSSSADCKDAFLVQSKLAGMSYKQIKEKGQFTEAESTLRGRFRTLTKQKEHRVRKPEWQERDVGIPFTPDFDCTAIDDHSDSTSWQSGTGSLKQHDKREDLA